jgi:hypothetical protein
MQGTAFERRSTQRTLYANATVRAVEENLGGFCVCGGRIAGSKHGPAFCSGGNKAGPCRATGSLAMTWPQVDNADMAKWLPVPHIVGMAKSKSKTIFSVADGAGGMMEVKDRRFEKGDWPIKFDVPVEQEQADRWPRYLSAACHRRGWSSSGHGQIERAENSGSITITANGQPQLDITWERKRDRPMKVRARLASQSHLSLTEAGQFFEEVNESCRSAVTEPIYVRGTLQYDGLAWRGELWLDDRTRLAPPSLQDETAVVGPTRLVHVDAILECVGQPDVAYARQQMLLEVSAFLSVVMQKAVRLPDQGRVWVWTADASGSEVRNLGYLEPANPLSMPVRGTAKPVPLYALDALDALGNRPRGGIDGSTNEISIRNDIADLWKLYRSLDTEHRVQFLQAAAKWQEAVIHWQDRPSLSFSLMAVACEALKPPDAVDRQNYYDVIEALLGRTVVDRIRQNPFPAHRVRGTHLHAGEFHGSELVMMTFLSSYQDPTFRDAHSEMFLVTPKAIIEWLRRQGNFQMPAPKNQRNVHRWLRDNIFVTWAVILGLGLAIGWLLRS